MARYYCPTARETYGLLPDFLASHLPGTLAEIEAVAAEVESGPSIEAVAEKLRPDIGLLGAVRWVRRRVEYTRRALAVTPGLLPQLFAGIELKLRAFARVLETMSVLETLRDRLAAYVGRVSSPFGLRRYLRGGRTAHDPDQQRVWAVERGAET